jgi:hypothetical protein
MGGFTMLDFSQLESIRRAMEEEHRRDLEALERLKRFMPANASRTVSATALMPPAANSGQSREDDARDLEHSDSSGSIIAAIERVFREHPERAWDGPRILNELKRMGDAPKAVNPMTTISVSLKKLSDRSVIRLVRPGSGRTPHLYQWQPTVDRYEREIKEMAESEALAEGSV